MNFGENIFQIARVNSNKIERVPSKNVKGVLTYGPWGGNGGSLFDDGVYDGIRQINLSRNVGIVSLRVCYDQNGQPVRGSKNGGTGGFKKDKVAHLKKSNLKIILCLLHQNHIDSGNCFFFADCVRLPIRNLDSHNRLLRTCNDYGP